MLHQILLLIYQRIGILFDIAHTDLDLSSISP